MANERRVHLRLIGPFDGSWDGASGMRDCRVTDLSAGGCFIDAYACHPVGGRLETEIKINGQAIRLPSEVVYVDRIQGFAVRFLDTDPLASKRLTDAIAATAR